MPGAEPDRRAGLSGFARRVIEIWALLGGIILFGVALMTTWSATSGVVFHKPLPGDFEMTEMLTAVAVFMWLPYCQINNANVAADIFTARAGLRTVALLGVVAGVVALAFGAALIWRMYAGLLDYRQYVETTAILRIPIWYAYVPALISLALLCAASLISLGDAIRTWMQTD